MSSQRLLQRVSFQGPAGDLEGLLHRPAAPARLAAVVSHPHPLFGGTMDNKVAYRVARALEDAGGLVLRYNFRGVGGSAGTHDEGRGEKDDLRAALAYLRREGGSGLPTLLAGFSFGAAVTAGVGCAEPDVDALLLVGLSVRAEAVLAALRDCRRPIAIIQGERDEHGPPERMRPMLEEAGVQAAWRIIPGTGHFFDERQDELSQAVTDLLRSGALGPRLQGA